MNSDFATRELSVVVGSLDAAGTIRDCLAALQTACEGIDAEILVADASADDSARLARAAAPDARVLALPVGTLVPSLWGAGLGEARGRVVAFTIAQCAVDPGWARALLDGIRSGAVGAGGRLGVRAGT